MIFPQHGGAPPPADDLPEDIKDDYLEAASVLGLSPRSSAALLRLALQKLLAELGGKGKNINDDIGSLVKAGVPLEMQKVLDSVRVIGNEAVHPGVLDLKDDQDTALKLFGAINLIVKRLITEPKEIEELYARVPETKKDAIKKRDEP